MIINKYKLDQHKERCRKEKLHQRLNSWSGPWFQYYFGHTFFQFNALHSQHHVMHRQCELRRMNCQSQKANSVLMPSLQVSFLTFYLTLDILQKIQKYPYFSDKKIELPLHHRHIKAVHLNNDNCPHIFSIKDTNVNFPIPMADCADKFIWVFHSERY